MERKPEQQTDGKKKKKGVRAWFKKRWRAVKHTVSCTQSNEVVPFHTQSDQDPSDPQPGPSEQPYLRVFKPAVLADTADCPGCHCEQTPLEDPVDPQQDPSGLKQTAPEEPADHRPAPSNQQQTDGKKKKKGVRAWFKKRWRAVKHTVSCTQSNEVVPFHTQSDQDPSDPQPGPSEQPYLRVFKPAVLADTADCPGCHCEQTPLEDPVDPQQDPSGLKQTAPEEPAASQPGSSNLSPYALRILSYFRPPRFFTYPAPWMYEQPFLDELDEYKAFSSLYEVGTKNLGKGHQGIVYEGTRRSDGLKVAIKFMHKFPRFDKYIHVPGHDKPLFSEVALNLLLQKPEKCPNIVDLMDWFEEEYTHILVLEYPYPCFTVKDFIRVERLSENQARDLMRQAVNAAKHCIDHNVCHGGLEVRNVLINVQTMTLKLIDFGCGHFASTWGEPGTKIYGRAHAVADTVYGLGKLLLYLTRSDWVIQFYNHVKLDDPEIKDLGLTEECLDLINRCKFAPQADRPTLEEILDHEWFKQG
ncbi:serine/threonine-protein kinase pim-2-like [Triplophysa rosa]|uniref:serine/threonine-protein kinase pim-2-like n=1 Tax=Triplophysa rosa TaxID=992332 RepID=UPI002545D83F|nr:serine/threonine-protein kinase pim-2-like [Triplophysa rosa]